MENLLLDKWDLITSKTHLKAYLLYFYPRSILGERR